MHIGADTWSIAAKKGCVGVFAWCLLAVDDDVILLVKAIAATRHHDSGHWLFLLAYCLLHDLRGRDFLMIEEVSAATAEFFRVFPARCAQFTACLGGRDQRSSAVLDKRVGITAE